MRLIEPVQRHVGGDGVNHLGGRRVEVGCGLSSPGDPCGDTVLVLRTGIQLRLDAHHLWCFVVFFGGRGGRGSSFDVGGSAVVRSDMLG